MRRTWILCSLFVILGGIIFFGVIQQYAYSKSSNIIVFFEGKQLHFDDAQPIIIDNRTLVPFRTLFETLGFTVNWDQSGDIQKAIGTKDGLTIELEINSTNAKVNGKNVTLDVPAQIVNKRTLVPLRFVSENSGYKVSFSSDHGVTTIQIGDGGGGITKVTNPVPTKEKIEPYVVKGQVVDKQGHPQPEVTIYADNQLLYNSNILGVTDENGRYRIELERIATSWNMSADLKHEFNGKMYGFNLSSDTDLPFAGNTGAIRNFTWKTSNGDVFLYTADLTNPYDENLLPPQVGEIEVTLTPISPLLDGSTGQTITKRAVPIAGGNGLSSVPIGRYKATARWIPDGQTPVPMLINVRNNGKFAESTEFDFEDPYDLMIYSIELEVKLP